MEKLPVEVLEGICNVFDDRVTLKALRLVNKKFADIAASSLFKTLVVFQHSSSWRRVGLIAHRPWLARWVKKLEIVPLVDGNNAGTFIEWKQKSRSHRVQCHLKLGNRGAAVAELVESLDDKLAVVLRLQQRWETWQWWDSGHRNIERLAQRFPSHQAPFSLPLPALSEIETAWPFDVSMTGPHLGRPERAANFRPGFRDVRGAANKRSNAHLSFALLNLHNSGLKITTLELHQYREILEDQVYPVPVLGYLKHLKLRFRHHFTVKWHTAKPWAQDGLFDCHDYVLAPYLANAGNLETLILSQQISNGTDMGDFIFLLDDIIPMLSTTGSWPKLRSIWVDALFTDNLYLVHFLMKHGKTLRSIHLNRPVEDEYYWRLLASSIRAQYANTECIISSSDDKIFRSNSDCDIDQDMSEMRYDWVVPEKNLAALEVRW